MNITIFYVHVMYTAVHMYVYININICKYTQMHLYIYTNRAVVMSSRIIVIIPPGYIYTYTYYMRIYII
jgi:hypothetical protein